MGTGILFWSWMTLSMPLHQQDIAKANQQDKEVKIEQTQNQAKTGIASFYHDKFVGRQTANGEVFSNHLFTCASNHYKLGTYLKVTNKSNKRVVYVKVNDRMGHQGRIIDLSKVAAKELNFVNKGLTRVKIEVVAEGEAKQQILALNQKWKIEESLNKTATLAEAERSTANDTEI